MARHALLNNIEHKDLRVITRHGSEFGDNMMCVPVFPVEFRLAQACYPLLFVRDANGEFQVVALLGLAQDENLFIENGLWDALYKPLMVEKGPFLIGRGHANSEQETLSIHVDLDDPRLSTEEGQPIFLAHGGNSDYIENVASILSTIHQSQGETAEFVAALSELALIESFALDYDSKSGQSHRLSGYCTISEDKLKQLNAAQLAELHKKGYLELIYMLIASMSHLSSLIQRQQRRNHE